ncbi:hypothetical protein [Acidipila sp. EB88]|uniref:hypothetical protein n=1 Tax=Acidipila sp. EB88 TaxID=2305226 RepID=UPI000F5E2A60|nr:hypothetical protein [Acidipila sp. EB88]RRA49680.1 hypothetical protein D1Y84_16780 [Acidipila sp. EB88]
MIQTNSLVQVGRRTLVRYPRPRRLGSLFIPQRRSYLLIMPMILLSASLICFATGSDFSMILGALTLTGVSAYLLFDLLGRRAPLRVSLVLAITLGLAYGLGTVNTWYTLPRGDATLGEFLHKDTEDLAHAMAFILMSIASLVGLGELFETPIFGEDFELRFNNRSVLFLTLGTAVLGASFLHGSTGFMGAATEEGAEAGRLGYLASLSEWLSGSLLALAVCMSLNIRGRFLKLYTRALSILLFIMVFPLGRRIMIFAVVLSLLALRLGRYKIPYSPLKKIVLLGLLGGGVYFATIGFFYLRVAGYGLARPTLAQRVSAAIQLAHDKSYADIKEDFSKNVQTRTFLLGFIGDLVGFTSAEPGAHGTDISGQLQLAIPSLLYPEKNLNFSEENLANELFGAHYLDEANSIYSTGAVDFGFWGILFYPLAAVIMVRAFFEFIGEAMPLFASSFVIIASLSVILEPETAADSYFLLIRSGILFGSVVWAVMSLPEFRIKNVGL